MGKNTLNIIQQTKKYVIITIIQSFFKDVMKSGWKYQIIGGNFTLLKLSVVLHVR